MIKRYVSLLASACILLAHGCGTTPFTANETTPSKPTQLVNGPSFRKIRPFYLGPLSITVTPSVASKPNSFKVQGSVQPMEPIISFHSASSSNFGTQDNSLNSKWKVHFPTNAQHASDGMGRYFDPDDPTYLQGITIPEPPQPPSQSPSQYPTGTFQINQDPPVDIDVATLAITPRMPAVTSLSILRERYDCAEVEQVGTSFRVRFNLDAIKLSDVDTVLRDYNQYIEEPISSGNFSSLKSIRLMKLYAELVTRNQDIIDAVDLNFRPTSFAITDNPVNQFHGEVKSINSVISKPFFSTSDPRNNW